jgi:hypothetical protein
MEAAARIVQLHPVAPLPSVQVDGDRIVVDHITLTEPSLARFLGARPEDSRAELVERALRIGLLAIQDAGTSLDVELVRREFEALLQNANTLNERAATTLDTVLRQNFADGDGRLPRTLEKFLGDKGQLRAFVGDLFDETRRDSAIGRMHELLGRYFDGDASRLAQLLDPTRLNSPLYQFRTEVTESFGKLNERLTAIEAASAARADERSRSAAKGADFEDAVGQLLADVCHGSSDLLERTGDETGAVIRSKKGDFLVTLDERVTRARTYASSSSARTGPFRLGQCARSWRRRDRTVRPRRRSSASQRTTLRHPLHRSTCTAMTSTVRWTGPPRSEKCWKPPCA